SLRGRQALKLWISNRTQQYGVSGQTNLPSLLRERYSVILDRCSANIRFKDFEAKTRHSCDGFQHCASFSKYLMANSVTGQKCDLCLYRLAHCSCCWRSASKSRSSICF